MTLPPIVKTLYTQYKDLRYYLNFSTPFELVIAAILSPQIRDEVVNKVTPALFTKYRTPAALATANLDDVIDIIKPVTFAGSKARHLIGAATILTHEFGSKVPRTVEELTRLPGVGEKTAHAILQNAFDIVEGICVDTHVLRVSYRIGLTTSPTNAKKTEEELKSEVPKTHWKNYPWLMKAHGRAICTAPTPSCSKCPVEKLCPKKGVTKQK